MIEHGMQSGVTDQDLERLSSVPAVFRGGGRSLLDVVRGSGFAELRGQLPARDLADYLRRHAAFIDEWVRYSEDKRTSGGWYFRPPHSVGRVVANSSVREQHYVDIAAACAAFIIAELGAVLDREAAV